MAKPKPPRKRPNMIRCRRKLSETEGKLIQRLFYIECHARGMTWKQVGVIFRVHESVCSLEAKKGFPVDLDPEVAADIVSMMRAGPEATWKLLVSQASK